MTGEKHVKELGQALSALCRAYRRHLAKGRPRIPFDELLRGFERDIAEHGWDQSLLKDIQAEIGARPGMEATYDPIELELSRIWTMLNDVGDVQAKAAPKLVSIEVTQ